MKKVKLVIAGNVKQFEEFVLSKGFNPKDKNSHPYRYANKRENILCFEADDVIKIGTYYKLENLRELEDECNRSIR